MQLREHWVSGDIILAETEAAYNLVRAKLADRLTDVIGYMPTHNASQLNKNEIYKKVEKTYAAAGFSLPAIIAVARNDGAYKVINRYEDTHHPDKWVGGIDNLICVEFK